MNAIKITPSFILSIFFLMAVLTHAAPSMAQTIPVVKAFTYQDAINNAKAERWQRWLTLKKALDDDRKMLLAKVREKYNPMRDNATTVAQAKGYLRDEYAEADKVNAAVNEEVHKTLETLNDTFVYNVEQICEQYGKPVPRWLNRYRTR
jgi:hypothetical protein